MTTAGSDCIGSATAMEGENRLVDCIDSRSCELGEMRSHGLWTDRLLHYRAGPFRALWNLSTFDNVRQTAGAAERFSSLDMARDGLNNGSGCCTILE